MLNRFPELLPVTAMKTYQAAAPLSTHFRPATCAEVDCPNYLNGWTVHVEILNPAQLHAIRTSAYKYAEHHVAEGRTLLIFEAGQPCFYAGSHRIRLEREARFFIKSGDHRGNPDGQVAELSVSSWVDDFGEHQERIAEQAERG